jgi:hypothetical protein
MGTDRRSGPEPATVLRGPFCGAEPLYPVGPRSRYFAGRCTRVTNFPSGVAAGDFHLAAAGDTAVPSVAAAVVGVTELRGRLRDQPRRPKRPRLEIADEIVDLLHRRRDADGFADSEDGHGGKGFAGSLNRKSREGKLRFSAWTRSHPGSVRTPTRSAALRPASAPNPQPRIS